MTYYVGRCLAYINNHLEDNISLDDLAKVTGYSPYYLNRKLKEELQEPVGISS